MKKALPAIFFLFFAILFVKSSDSVFADAGPVDARQLRSVSGPNPGQLTLTWNQTDPLTQSFNLYYGLSSGNYSYSVIGVPAAGNGGRKSLTIGALQPGRTYYVAVQALGGQNMALSQELVDMAMAAPVSSSSAPAPVNGVSQVVTAVSGPAKGQITLTWFQTQPDNSDFNVLYGLASGQYSYSAISLGVPGMGGMKSVAISALNPGQTYYFAVQPVGGSNPSMRIEASAKASN